MLNDDGTPVRWPGALTRNLLRAVDFLPFLYGVGLVAMLANRDFKRLGDLAAGTVVVYQAAAAEPAQNDPRSRAGRAAGRARPRGAARGARARRALRDASRASASRSSPSCRRRSSAALDGERAAARLLGMANYLAGRQ